MCSLIRLHPLRSAPLLSSPLQPIQEPLSHFCRAHSPSSLNGWVAQLTLTPHAQLHYTHVQTHTHTQRERETHTHAYTYTHTHMHTHPKHTSSTCPLYPFCMHTHVNIHSLLLLLLLLLLLSLSHTHTHTHTHTYQSPTMLHGLLLTCTITISPTSLGA